MTRNVKRWEKINPDYIIKRRCHARDRQLTVIMSAKVSAISGLFISGHSGITVDCYMAQSAVTIYGREWHRLIHCYYIDRKRLHRKFCYIDKECGYRDDTSWFGLCFSKFLCPILFQFSGFVNLWQNGALFFFKSRSQK